MFSYQVALPSCVAGKRTGAHASILQEIGERRTTASDLLSKHRPRSEPRAPADVEEVRIEDVQGEIRFRPFLLVCP